MFHVNRLIWDNWNVAHIARHEVTPDEVEQVCHSEPMVSKTYDKHLRLIGSTDGGRILTIIIASQGEDVYYPVTARAASRKERRRYREYKDKKNI